MLGHGGARCGLAAVYRVRAALVKIEPDAFVLRHKEVCAGRKRSFGILYYTVLELSAGCFASAAHQNICVVGKRRAVFRFKVNFRAVYGDRDGLAAVRDREAAGGKRADITEIVKRSVFRRIIRGLPARESALISKSCASFSAQRMLFSSGCTCRRVICSAPFARRAVSTEAAFPLHPSTSAEVFVIIAVQAVLPACGKRQGVRRFGSKARLHPCRKAGCTPLKRMAALYFCGGREAWKA